MTVRVTDTLHNLERDLRSMPVTAARETAKIVRDNAKLGNRLAKANAKSSAGKHGKHYHKSFSAEAIDAFTWEYGPDSAKPQGGMKFEHGEGRQTAPHLDLNRSADVIGEDLGRDTRQMLADLFWP